MCTINHTFYPFIYEMNGSSLCPKSIATIRFVSSPPRSSPPSPIVIVSQLCLHVVARLYYSCFDGRRDTYRVSSARAITFPELPVQGHQADEVPGKTCGVLQRTLKIASKRMYRSRACSFHHLPACLTAQQAQNVHAAAGAVSRRVTLRRRQDALYCVSAKGCRVANEEGSGPATIATFTEPPSVLVEGCFERPTPVLFVAGECQPPEW